MCNNQYILLHFTTTMPIIVIYTTELNDNYKLKKKSQDAKFLAL